MIVDKLVWTGYGYVNKSFSINLTIPSYVNYIVIKCPSFKINEIKIVKGCTTNIGSSSVSYNSNNTLKLSSTSNSNEGYLLWFEGYQYL